MFLISKSKIACQFCYIASRSAVNYYKILDVHPSATSAQIKSKYYQLAKKFHPDSNILKDSKEQEIINKINYFSKAQKKDEKFFNQNHKSHFSIEFLQINEAYLILKDYNKRLEYDRSIGFIDNPTKQSFRHDYTYDRSKHFKNYQEYQYFKQKQQEANKQRINKERATAINNLLFAFAGVSALSYVFIKFFYTSSKVYADQSQIRRKNLILSKENIDSSPFAQQRRMQQYAKQIFDKKIKGYVIDLKVRGAGQESTRAKYKKTHGMQNIPGIHKINESNQQINLLNQKQDYM